MIVWLTLCNFLYLLLTIECYIVDPGPRVIATKGEIWPKPQFQIKTNDYLVVKPQNFEFKISTHSNCTLLLDAIKRYKSIINSHYEVVENNVKYFSKSFHKKRWIDDDNFFGYLNSATVNLNGECEEDEFPTFGIIEKYQIIVNREEANLTSTTIWGILRALESFSQSLYLGNDEVSLRINLTSITDFPRFGHRGLLVDTSRHYIPINVLLENLDAMAYNKMNVLHWHIVDDESFPYVSEKFPKLSEQGAYHPSLVYTVADIKTVIEYARVRGIRVIPEFDSPGHTRSWGVAFRELLTECYDSGKKTGKLGPIDPTKDFTYNFLKEFFQELSTVFPDEYVHLGGDEVGFECWESNQDIRNFMKYKNISTFEQLESYYIQKLVDIVVQEQSKIIVWEEVFNNNVSIPLDSIVQVWLSPFYDTLQKVISSGRKAVLSSCWYLDHLQTGGDWKDFYLCEPCVNLTSCDNVIGGEACMWSEVVNVDNFIARIWPRTAAVAERLWSSELVQDDIEAERRIEEHTCRLNRRNINAQPPTGPGYCL